MISDEDNMSTDSSGCDSADEVILRSAKDAEEKDKQEENKTAIIEQFIAEKVYKDATPEARAGRRRAMVRAAYGEFMATLLFLTPIFCVVANSKANNWSPEAAALAIAFVGGFQAIAVSFAFSSVSG
jgi:hypothetical protein